MDNDINLIDIPPKILESFNPDNISKIKELDTIIVAGEVCNKRTMCLWGSSVNLINAYGPTESTVCTTFYKYSNGDSNTNIGKPISNKKLYVLNSCMHPVPVGVPGELYIGGDGLARGYLKRPKLTEERFIPNPFASEDDKSNSRNLRLYKSGDLVRRLPDGNLEYIGRNDNQVKIRGFRVELGAIESKITEHHNISQAVVLYREHHVSGEYLAAYYMSDTELTHIELHDYLSDILPDYMIPSLFRKMDEFPLNTSGKIDVKAFPELKFKTNEDSYAAPETEFERQLCTLWESILGIEKVSVNDDFFMIGGNSLKAIQIVSQIRDMDYSISVKDIFDFKTIKRITQAYSSSSRTNMNLKNNGLYIEINPEMKSNPIFIFPPDVQGPEAYFSNIVPVLRSNSRLILFYNFYARSIKKFAKNSKHLPSIEELASEYVAVIKQIQPSGPYNLFGWSLGGVLSVEIAGQLVKERKDIENLIVCDAYFKLKKTISMLRQNSSIQYKKNIIHEYDPDIIELNHDANINLLKATNVSESYDMLLENSLITKDEIENHKNIESYYVEQTNDNKLAEIMHEHN